MADIVLGIGSSHGPLLSTPPEQWDLRAKADRANKSHWYRGDTYDFESLLSAREAALLAVSLPNPFERRAGAPGPGTQRLAANLMLRMRTAPGMARCVR